MDTTSSDRKNLEGFLSDLFAVLESRKRELPEGSYTASLFESGEDVILRKLMEEATEVLLASKDGTREELVWEASDLLFHLMVLLVAKDVSLDEIAAELEGRRKR
jgi:phosphoribosyl-ATP pyrophosphohydrolase